MSSIISEIEELKIIYKDIVDGCSYDEVEEIYVKHLSDLENSEVSRKKLAIFNKYKRDGLPSEEEKLNQLRESEQWDKSKDEEILSLKYFVSDNEKNLKFIIPQQHGPIIKQIDNAKEKLMMLDLEKRELLGRTANEFAERDGFNYFIYLSLYKDKECKTSHFNSFEDFDNIEDGEISKYISIVESKLSLASEKNIRKIAVLGFFLNCFNFAKETPHVFINMPVSQLSPYQTLLFSLGIRNLNIMSQSKGSPPDLIGDVKVDDIVLWFDQRYSILSSKRSSSE